MMFLKKLSILATLSLLVLACGPRETPEQHLERLRLAHEITPTGYTTIHSSDGQPVTVVDLRIVNHSDEALPHLTVMVRVIGSDGAIKSEHRAVLDLEGAQPGVGIQTAATVPGLEVGEKEQVQVELESGLAPDVLHGFREWSDVTKQVS